MQHSQSMPIGSFELFERWSDNQVVRVVASDGKQNRETNELESECHWHNYSADGT